MYEYYLGKKETYNPPARTNALTVNSAHIAALVKLYNPRDTEVIYIVSSVLVFPGNLEDLQADLRCLVLGQFRTWSVTAQVFRDVGILRNQPLNGRD